MTLHTPPFGSPEERAELTRLANTNEKGEFDPIDDDLPPFTCSHTPSEHTTACYLAMQVRERQDLPGMAPVGSSRLKESVEELAHQPSFGESMGALIAHSRAQVRRAQQVDRDFPQVTGRPPTRNHMDLIYKQPSPPFMEPPADVHPPACSCKDTFRKDLLAVLMSWDPDCPQHEGDVMEIQLERTSPPVVTNPTDRYEHRMDGGTIKSMTIFETQPIPFSAEEQAFILRRRHR